MNTNPLLKKLGFSNTDRVVIIHTDDIGMCQASVTAYEELFKFGLITSGAVMIPCPWSLAASKIQQNIPSADLGVHITLTSEWQNYRWGPISTRDPKSGLLDEEGCFYHKAAQAQEHGDPEYARIEMEAQIRQAIKIGIKPTHVDTHMGTVAHPKYMNDYIKLSLQNGFPPMLFRLDVDGWMAAGLDRQTAETAVMLVKNLEDQSVPLLDNLATIPLNANPENRMEDAQEIFKKLPAGLTHFIIHPSVDTPELRAITPDWACRAADYELFMKEEMVKFLDDQGIHRIGYRKLLEMMPDTVFGI